MDELEKLLPYYERELARLRQEMLRFEREHPQVAARLSMSGGQSEDPHVERLLQCAALLNARVSRRIEDHYPEFTEACIEAVFPVYLRRVPSCSIARFDAASMFDNLTQTVLMPRDTELEHRPSLCRFRTAWDVTLAPISITRAQFSLSSSAPPLASGQLSRDTIGIISIEFASLERMLTIDSELMPRALRVYLHADRFLAAALIDAILLRPQTAFVEVDGCGRWQALEKLPASAVGFADADAVVNEPRRARQPALRLLIEYAAFPYKFRFIDFDFAALLRTAGPCKRFMLHFPVAAHAASASAVQRLSQLNADHLRLFCTPVINLFHANAKPVDVVANMHTYPVALPTRDGALAVIHSIDSVRILHGAEGDGPGPEIPRYQSPQHRSPMGMFWLRERDVLNARVVTGCDTAIRIVDVNERPVTPDASKLGIELTCTNGDAPTAIDIGAPEGDLHSETLNLSRPVTLLVAPSASRQPPSEGDTLWKLISSLSPNHLSLSQEGFPAVQDLLFQLASSGPPEAARYIAGIIGLSARSILEMMHIEPAPMPTLVPGIEITLTIDVAAFAGHSLYTFAQLMERYFLRYVDGICLKLIVHSDRGDEVYRGEPRPGTLG